MGQPILIIYLFNTCLYFVSVSDWLYFLRGLKKRVFDLPWLVIQDLVNNLYLAYFVFCLMASGSALFSFVALF